MTERANFVASILARPGDDLRRLAFADWLDEHNDEPRAAFIRHQVAAHRLPKWSAECIAHEDAADRLLARHRPEWLGPWAGRLLGYEFRRGFVRDVRVGLTECEEHVDALFDWEPVTRVTVEPGDRPTPSDEEAARLLRRPGVARLRELLIGYGQNTVDFDRSWHRQVAAAGHLAGLRLYGMTDTFRSAPLDVLTLLCAAPHLRNLRELRLDLNEYQSDGPRGWPATLAGATFAHRLTRVEMDNHRVALPWVAALAGGAFPNLRGLDCFDTRDNGNLPPGVEHEDWGELFRTRDLPRLRKLVLSTRHLAAYARSPMAERVRDLTVHSGDEFEGDATEDLRAGWRELVRRGARPRKLTIRHDAGRETFRRVARSGWLRSSRELDFDGDSQWDVFRDSNRSVRGVFRDPAPLPRLAALGFDHCGQLEGLENWPGLKALTRLAVTTDYGGYLHPQRLRGAAGGLLRDLDGVSCSADADLDDLVAFLAASGVTRLGLHLRDKPGEPPLTADGVERLVTSAGFQRLARLVLWVDAAADIWDHAAALLADTAATPNLAVLRLQNGDYETRVPDALRARFGPDCGYF